MGVYRVLKHHHDPDIGLGFMPRIICRVLGHELYRDQWIQQLVVGGELTMVSLPAMTCGRCLMSLLDESQIQWLQAGYEKNVELARQRTESAKFMQDMFNRYTEEGLPEEDNPVWQEIEDEWGDEE